MHVCAHEHMVNTYGITSSLLLIITAMAARFVGTVMYAPMSLRMCLFFQSQLRNLRAFAGTALDVKLLGLLTGTPASVRPQQVPSTRPGQPPRPVAASGTCMRYSIGYCR